MGLTEVAVATTAVIQLFCVAPKRTANTSEVQSLRINLIQEKELDIEVGYLNYGTIYGVKNYGEYQAEEINLPLPHGVKGISFQIKTQLDDWFVYESDNDGNITVKPLKCEYREVSK